MVKKDRQHSRFEGDLDESSELKITVDGIELTARIECDAEMGPPWEEHDGHGIVSEWTTRDKRPCERILSRDGQSRRYYDVQKSMDKAEQEGWDAPPYGEGTKRQQAARAVEADFQNLKSWCDDEWTWVGVVIEARKNGIVLTDCAASLWGISSNSEEYLTEVANELIEEAMTVANEKLKTMIDRLTK